MEKKIKMWFHNMNHAEQIRIICNKMVSRLQKRCRKIVKIRPTSNVKKMTWTTQITLQTTSRLTVFKMDAPWMKIILTKNWTWNKHHKIMRFWINSPRIKIMNDSTIYWIIYQQQLFKYSSTQKESLNQKKMK